MKLFSAMILLWDKVVLLWNSLSTLELFNSHSKVIRSSEIVNMGVSCLY